MTFPEREPGRTRRFLYAILLAGLAGTGTELLLLGHFEDAWQFVPLVLIGTSVLTSGWRLLGNSPSALGAFRIVMALNIVSGGLGVYLHFRGNVAFEFERTPELSGFELFAAAMTGATPSLAPGAMAMLGAVGLAAELGARTKRISPSIGE